MKKLPLLIAALFLLAPRADAGTVLYQTTEINASARFSDTQSGFQTYDAFTLAQTASLETVAWSGFWLDFTAPVPAAAPAPDVTNWFVGLYDDNGGQPGALVWSESPSAATVQSTFRVNVVWNVGTSFNVAYYDYVFHLPAGVGLTGGSTYWLSVMADGGSAPQSFAWLGATGGDSSSRQNNGAVSGDRSFRLEGTVPEPATLLLLATAGLALATRRRTRRQ